MRVEGNQDRQVEQGPAGGWDNEESAGPREERACGRRFASMGERERDFLEAEIEGDMRWRKAQGGGNCESS